jgi:hypothetical protein
MMKVFQVPSGGPQLGTSNFIWRLQDLLNSNINNRKVQDTLKLPKTK